MIAAVAVVVLGVAVVLLFAMVGELGRSCCAARQPEHERLELAAEGADGLLEGIFDNPVDTVVVLSSVCSSCARFLADPDEIRRVLDGRRWAVIVSSPTVRAGREFAERLNIGEAPIFIDSGGRTCRERFGVQSSPTLLIFSNGRLTAGWQAVSLSSVQSVLGVA